MDADPPTVAPHTNQEHAAWRAVQHGEPGLAVADDAGRNDSPWLVVGFAGALVSALVVGMFDHQLEREVLIAFFVPGVIYLADAVGVQTTALVVRGLSIGVEIRRIVVREPLTG